MVKEFCQKHKVDVDPVQLFIDCEQDGWKTKQGIKTKSLEAYLSSRRSFVVEHRKVTREEKRMKKFNKAMKKLESKAHTENMPWWDDPELNNCNVTTPAPWDNTKERVTETVEQKPLNRQKYSDALQDPRWQKKRLEVFQRDNWSCQLCGNGLNDGVPLNIHHRIYHTGRKPWEYDDKELLTICEKCHTKLHMK